MTAGDAITLVISNPCGPFSRAVEQANAAAEEERGDVDLQLVDEAGAEVLLHDVRSAGNGDVPVAGGRASLLQRRLDAVGDEGEGGSALLVRPSPGGDA